jgi:hypothetical protein
MTKPSYRYQEFPFSKKGRELSVRVVYRTRKQDMHRAYKAMVQSKKGLGKSLIGVCCKAKRQDIIFIGLSGVGEDLLETTIHECTHAGQLMEPKNIEQAATFTGSLAATLIGWLRGKPHSRVMDRPFIIPQCS